MKGRVQDGWASLAHLPRQCGAGAPFAELAQVAIDGQLGKEPRARRAARRLPPGRRSAGWAGPPVAGWAQLVKAVSWSPVVHVKPRRGAGVGIAGPAAAA